jgi:hypothetical protein
MDDNNRIIDDPLTEPQKSSTKSAPDHSLLPTPVSTPPPSTAIEGTRKRPHIKSTPNNIKNVQQGPVSIFTGGPINRRRRSSLKLAKPNLLLPQENGHKPNEIIKKKPRGKRSYEL